MKMEQAEPKKCLCGASARPGQRYCLKCHNQHQKKYQDRDSVELRKFRAMAKVMADDRDTKVEFESRFSRRRVIFDDEEGNSEPAEVIGFLPRLWLRLMRSNGKTCVAHIKDVIEDKGWKE